MEPQIIEGIWDEVALSHADRLHGRRVEIRVLTSSDVWVEPDNDAFEASMLRIAKLTKGSSQISPRPLRAEDFYESNE